MWLTTSSRLTSLRDAAQLHVRPTKSFFVSHHFVYLYHFSLFRFEKSIVFRRWISSLRSGFCQILRHNAPVFWVLCFWFAPKSPAGFFVGSFLVAARRSAQSYWAKCSEHDFRIENFCSTCLMFNLWYPESSVPLIWDWCLDLLSESGTFQCGIYLVGLSEAFVRTKSSYLKLHFGCERFGKRQGVFLRIRAFAWGTSLIS